MAIIYSCISFSSSEVFIEISGKLILKLKTVPPADLLEPLSSPLRCLATAFSIFPAYPWRLNADKEPVTLFLKEDILTVEEAKEEILRVMRGKGKC